MPSQDHNLREAIAERLYIFDHPSNTSLDEIDEHLAALWFDQADAVLVVLSSHPEAVLSLFGTVRKGVMMDYPYGWFVDTDNANGAAMEGTVPVLVVRPRGAATACTCGDDLDDDVDCPTHGMGVYRSRGEATDA